MLISDRAQGYLTSRNLTGLYRRIGPPSLLNSIEVSNNHTKFSPKRKIYTLSAFDEMSGIEQAKGICKYVQRSEIANSKTFLDDLSYTLNNRRSLFSWKFAFHAYSRDDFISALSNKVKYVYSPKSVTIGFCFTGQGAQW
jgi:acyl transferase domain-containing protein